MTEAEKLEKLLYEGNSAYKEYCNGWGNCRVCPYGDEEYCTMRFIAEYLAEHGVTVKEAAAE